MSYKCSKSKTTLLQFLHKENKLHVSKYNYYVVENNEVMTKTTTEAWLAKVTVILIHRIAPLI